MNDGDPRPWLRCRCVHRRIFLPEFARLLAASDYNDRCAERPTQEDGLCDHCRQDEGCPCCAPIVCGAPAGSCRWHGSNRRLVDLNEPCRAFARDREEATP